ncbi:MAG: DUF4272 domain-containing protein [Planctomycetota bacterium]
MTSRAVILLPGFFFPPADALEDLCAAIDLGRIWTTSDTEKGEARVVWPGGPRFDLRALRRGELQPRLFELIEGLQARGVAPGLTTRLYHTISWWEVEVEPGWEDPQDRPMGLFCALVQVFDGLGWFAGKPALLDGDDRDLLRAGPALPDAARVAARALVLLGLSFRGLLEQNAGKEGAAEVEALRQRLAAWLQTTAEGALWAEAEPEEQELLSAALGAPEPQAIVDAVWQAEGAQLLLWALGARPLPPHDEQEHPYRVARELGFLEPEAPALLAAPELRPTAELEERWRLLTGVHWRLREHQSFSKKPVDFRAWAVTGDDWLGGFSLEGIPLDPSGDLTVGGAPVSEADPDLVQRASSIALERHRAANWLVGTHPRYSFVKTPT